jgi:hypothetical protein
MDVSQLLIDALLSKYKAQIDDATAKISVYLHNPVGIGEHPQFTEELDKLINIVSTAEENIETIHKHLGENNG